MEAIKIIAFKLGEEEYGLDINHVQSIERTNQFTRVPNASSHIKGVYNLRGTITPIVDLKSIVDEKQAQFSDKTRVIIVNYEDNQLGFIVDQTNAVIEIQPEDTEAAASSGFESDYFENIAKIDDRLIILLKIESLINVLEPTN